MNWELAHSARVCGCCREVIASGVPVLRVTVHRLVRCVACAKRGFHTEPPDTLEAPALVVVPTSQPTVFHTPAKFAQDWKRAQSGDR